MDASEKTDAWDSGEELRKLAATRQIDALCDEYERATNNAELLSFRTFLDRIPAELQGTLVRELTGIARERLLSSPDTNATKRIREMNSDLSPDHRAYLEECLTLDETALYQGPSDVELVTSNRSSQTKKSRRLHVQCPHCSNPIELLSDTPNNAVLCTTCGSRLSLADQARETRDAETLKRIDRFELISRIGIGGFGTVWKARDVELDRSVAVKIPRHGQLSEHELDQFLREARSAAQLTHPNIVRVHEVGREDDLIYIVSDLIRGVSLADRLTASRPTVAEAIELCITIADAIDHAHQRGVVHRDLKPSNVMIDDDGVPHLMDFGLAKRDADELTITTSGQIVGTPAYMSPEQAGGQSEWADRRTDVYSLGVMLFELITGELPFRGNAQMQVQQRLTQEAPNARQLNRTIAIDLATICAKCLEREQGRRYQTAKQVRDELQRYLGKEPIRARPLSRLQRMVRWCERKPLQAFATLLVAIFALGGPVVAFVINAQRARLASLVEEKDLLIESKNSEAQKYRAESSQLRSQLEVWEGKAHPWTMWPPESQMPPKKRLLASLLKHRGRSLAAVEREESDISVAQRYIALAYLQEASDRPDEAITSLQAAVPPLERIRTSQPRSLSVAAGLLATYDHLARLTSATNRQESQQWVNAARDLGRQLAIEFPKEARIQAERLDRDLRSATTLGFDSASSDLQDAMAAEKKLSELWPNSIDKLYELTCALVGANAPLLEVQDRQESPITQPLD